MMTTPRQLSVSVNGGKRADCVGTAEPSPVVSTMIWPVVGTQAGGGEDDGSGVGDGEAGTASARTQGSVDVRW